MFQKVESYVSLVTENMRYNDKELVKISEGKAELEGILHHMKPQNNDWSDWYQQPSFKERTFKLISNLLFYFRVNELEPLGVLVLENAQIAYEHQHRGIPFAFSITFKVSDRLRDNEAKHVFSCRCDADVNKWVSALKVASYEYWRSQYTILRTKISMRTGKDPVLDYMRNKHTKHSEVNNTMTVQLQNSTFYSHVSTTKSFYQGSSYVENTTVTETTAVANLIDL